MKPATLTLARLEELRREHGDEYVAEFIRGGVMFNGAIQIALVDEMAEGEEATA